MLFISKEKAEKGGLPFAQALQSKKMMEIFNKTIEHLAVTLNPGGKWVDVRGKREFIKAPFTIIKRDREKRIHIGSKLKEKRELHDEVKSLAQTVGKEHKGLMQLAGFTEPAVQVVADQQQSSKFFSKFDSLKNGWQKFKEKAAKGVVSVPIQFVAKQVNTFSVTLFDKMQQPVQNTLLPKVVQTVILGLKR
jgi:hypothetical protein